MSVKHKGLISLNAEAKQALADTPENCSELSASSGSAIDLCEIIAKQQDLIRRLLKKVEVQEAVNRAYYAQIDAFEDFYMEARNMDPSLEEVAERHKVDTSYFM